MNSIFEKQYRSLGMTAQRHYPNESLVQFLGQGVFKLEHTERKSVRILEIGCGSGANLWMVSREGFDTYGVDFSLSGLELCREKLLQWKASANLVLADMRSLPFPAGYFDIVFDVVSMQHLDIQGHADAYREIARCLKPGGSLFQYHLGQGSFSFEYGGGKRIDECTIDEIRSTDAPLRGNGPTCFLTPDIARSLIASSRLVSIEIETVTRSYPSKAENKIKVEYLSVSCAAPTE
jgi:SAM-dependent methyltransferase